MGSKRNKGVKMTPGFSVLSQQGCSCSTEFVNTRGEAEDSWGVGGDVVQEFSLGHVKFDIREYGYRRRKFRRAIWARGECLRPMCIHGVEGHGFG